MVSNGNEINYNYLLFTNWNGNNWTTAASSFKMQYCKIIKDGVLIRNLIPCKSTTTVANAYGIDVPANTKGLYDLVGGKFYTNQNTSGNDFTAGPDV